MDDIDMAQEGIEKAVHEHHNGGVPHARRAAIVIAALAALLAVTENFGRDAQTESLAQHILASDTWAQYQAKSVRRSLFEQSSTMLENLPAASPAALKAAADAKASASRMQSEPGHDGMTQLAERAHEAEHERDHQMHRYHALETASSGLQLSIVLVTVSVVTGISALMLGGGALGGLAVVYALLSGLSLI